jgi:D-alanyl-D-alanine carboxypeptidase
MLPSRNFDHWCVGRAGGARGADRARCARGSRPTGVGLPDPRRHSAVEPPDDPLSALDELAAAVKAAGIARVNGDVVVDDRLFMPHKFPDGLLSPMWVNENLRQDRQHRREQGLVAEVDTATALGVSKDGAGSHDRNRVTPTALATVYRRTTQAPYAQVLFDALPILGKDGTLANLLPASPTAGKVQMKTGNRVVGTQADQLIVLGNSLAGYIEATSGRRLTFMVGVSNIPIATPAEFEQITGDQAKMAEAKAFRRRCGYRTLDRRGRQAPHPVIAP